MFTSRFDAQTAKGVSKVGGFVMKMKASARLVTTICYSSHIDPWLLHRMHLKQGQHLTRVDLQLPSEICSSVDTSAEQDAVLSKSTLFQLLMDPLADRSLFLVDWY